jgi:sialic acid synthase SpsE
MNKEFFSFKRGPIFIAEISANHNGSLDNLKKLILLDTIYFI